MKIAVIVDSLDITRQAHSDGGQSYSKVAEILKPIFSDLEMAVFSGSKAKDLLSGLNSEDWDGLVLASNSIRHIDSTTRSSFSLNSDKVIEFIESGGGLLVLHQFDSELGSIKWPQDMQFNFALRNKTDDLASIKTQDPDDSLFNFPFSVDFKNEFEPQGSQLGDLFSWMKCAFPEGSMEVLLQDNSGDALIARSHNASQYRILVSAIPLDWHGSSKLLANSLVYTASGNPSQVVWETEEENAKESYQTINRELGVFNLPHDSLKPTVVDWLRSTNVTEFFLEDSEILKKQINNGLSFVVSSAKDGRFHFSGYGSVSAQVELESEIRELDFSQIGSNYARHPYILRNIVTSMSYASNRFPSIRAWNPKEDREFKNRFKSLEFSGMTITSALASLQTALSLNLEKQTISSILKKIKGLSKEMKDSHLALAIVSVVEGRTSFNDFLQSMKDKSSELSHQDTVNTLEWFAFFGHLHELDSNAEFGVEAVLAVLERLEQTTVEISDEKSVDESWSVAMAILLYPERLKLSCHASLENSLSSLQRFLAASSSTEQLGLRLRAAMCLSVAKQLIPNPVEELRANLYRFTRSSRTFVAPSKSNVEDSRFTRFSEQTAFMTEKNSELRNELRDRRPVWWLGAMTAWLISIGISLSVIFGWLQIFRFEALADIFAIPLGVAALWIFQRLLKLLDGNGLTPKWLSVFLNRIPWFQK